MTKDEFLKRAKGITVGHAVADALGVPVEFKSREALCKSPVTDMTGYGTHPVPRGAWSDDTSMSLCALEAISPSGIDLDRVMNNFVRWYRRDEFTPTGFTFDIGGACAEAIRRYEGGGRTPWECGESGEFSNGNGSLMRIHPFSLYLHRLDIGVDEKIAEIERASALTHAHDRSKIACGIFSFILWELLDSGKYADKDAVRRGIRRARDFYCDRQEFLHYKYRLCQQIAEIDGRLPLNGVLKPLREAEIKSSGYVVDTLEAAVFCLLNTDSYEECVLRAVNLGEDTDTVGAVAGALAGATYGYEAIPKGWRDALLRLDYVEELCEGAFG